MLRKVKKYWSKLAEYWYYSSRVFVLVYRSNPKITILLAVCTTITALAPIAYSYILFKEIVDAVFSLTKSPAGLDITFLIKLVVAYFIIDLVSRFAWRLIDYCDRIIYLDFGRFLTVKANEKFASLDFEDWENPKLNNLINKVTETYSWRPVNFGTRQIWLVQNLVSIISNTATIIALGPVYLVLIIISVIPDFIIQIKFSESVWNIHGAKAPIRRDFWNTTSYLSNPHYLPEIHIFNIQKTLLKRIENLYKKFFGYEKKELRKKAVSQLTAAILSMSVYFLLFGSILVKAIAGAISVGTLGFYVTRIDALSENLKGLFRNLSANFEDLLYVRDLFAVLNLRRKVSENHQGAKVTPPFTIEFKNVWFKYPQSKRYVLEDFNLTIKPNEKIALIGANGVGKTTIIKLLVRFYDVNKGQILINGHNLTNINLAHWRKLIGALFQDFNRYAYTIKENIRLGDINKPFEKELFDKATKKSGAKEFIVKLPKKERTVLSKEFVGGTDLSTGQWQKMALTRAFFRDAPLLILDEPTSAIDALAEAKIFDQIHQFEKDKTVVMISHRFSTVRSADKIYVIKGGKIVESGTHQYLIAQNKHYAKLFRLQARGYKE